MMIVLLCVHSVNEDGPSNGSGKGDGNAGVYLEGAQRTLGCWALRPGPLATFCIFLYTIQMVRSNSNVDFFRARIVCKIPAAHLHTRRLQLLPLLLLQ